jgi:predicted lipoprotein with Yx(FWY)xxD motif
MVKFISLAVVVAGLALAGCGGDEDSSDSDSTGAESTGATATTEQDAAGGSVDAAPGSTIKLGDSQFGQVLFGPDEGAIYYFDKEQGSQSECYGACAEAWPPVLTEGEPQAGQGVKANLLGTTERSDGTTQVTYDGHPLYYYAHEGPGEVTCHNVEEFGGLWLAVQASGEAVS